MFIVGLDLHLSDLIKSGKVTAIKGILGVLMSLGMGYRLASAFSFDEQSASFASIFLATNNVNNYGQTLMEK